MRGSIALDSFSRLREMLQGDTAGSVEFRLQGGRDVRGRPVLHIEIDGLITVRCQRCLEPLRLPLRITNTLLLLRQAEMADPAADDPAAPDIIEASEALDVAALVEDEILLSIPYAPAHEETACRPVPGTGPVRAGAFEQLARLKSN